MGIAYSRQQPPRSADDTPTVPPAEPVLRPRNGFALQLLPLLRPAYRAVYPTGPDWVDGWDEFVSV